MVQEVRHRNKNTSWKQERKQGKPNTSRKWGGVDKKCGKSQHKSEERCPASKATCHSCHKMGHWARVCPSGRSVNEVEETDTGEQTSYFLSSVSNATDTIEWTVILQVDSVPVEFKIDTGADVNVINEDTFHSLSQENVLSSSGQPRRRTAVSRLLPCDCGLQRQRLQVQDVRGTWVQSQQSAYPLPSC